MERAPPALGAYTLIVFDWDDTILPTTILRERSKAVMGRNLSPSNWGQFSAGLSVPMESDEEEIGGQFEALADLAKRTLEVAAQCGKVVMITNGSSDWIRTSCLRYMPSLWTAVEPIRRVSAKDLVQSVSRDPIQWKKQTFAQIFTEHFATDNPDGNAPKVVISIGDSLHERHALYNFYHTTSFQNVAIRSIKFVPLPGLTALKAQHSALAIHLPSIAELPLSCRSADLRYRFETLFDNNLDEEPPFPLSEEEEEDLSHITSHLAPDTECSPQPLTAESAAVLVWNAVEMNRLAEAEVREKVRQVVAAENATETDSDEDESSNTPMSFSTDGDCGRRNNATSDPERGGAAARGVGSFLRGAGISLSKMWGRGFSGGGGGGGDNHEGDTTRATTSLASFALTPTANTTLPVRRTVKLNLGNPYLVAFTHGFVFDGDYGRSHTAADNDNNTTATTTPTITRTVAAAT